MRKLLLSLSLLVMTAITAMAAVAEPTKSLSALEVVKEYTWTIDFVYGKGYEGFATSTQLDGLYDALGVTAEELDPEINNVTMVRAASEVEGVWTLSDDELVPLEGCSGGNWFGNYDGVGAPMGWGAGANTIYLQEMSLANGVYTTASTGQFPGLLSVGNENTIDLYICNGTKAAKVTVVINVYERQTEMEAPVTSFAALNVVKEYEWTVDFVLGKSYEGKTVSTTLDGIYEALGVSQADLDASIEDAVVTRIVDEAAENGETVYSLSDELKTPADASSGSWFGRYSNYIEAEDKTVPLSANAPMGWGAGCTIYTQNIALADGEFSILTGQYPGTYTAAGETGDVVELYICNGATAAKVSIKINITEPESVPFEEMTKADEVTFDLEAEYQPSSYITQPLTVDIAAIAEAIGVEASDIDDFYTWASEGVLVNDHNESSGGYFWKEDGYLGSWGASTSAFYIAVSGKVSEGNYLIAQMPGSTAFEGLTEPKTVSSQILFLGLEKYYVVNINFTVKPKEEFQGDKNKVGDESLAIQIVPNDQGQWAWGVTTPLDLEYIESKIGTQSFKLYSINKKTVKNDDETETVTYDWTDAYNCDPSPGFWYKLETAESGEYQGCVLAQGWGDNSFGLTYAGGEITWYQYPGLRQAGDSYKTHIFLMNEANGKYLDYTIYVEYVEETGAQVETVGTGELEHIVTAAEAAEVVFTIDLDTNEMFEALGLDAETVDAASVVAPKSSTTYVTTSFGESLGYSTDGYFVGVDDEENCTLQAVVEANDGAVQVSFDLMDLAFAGAEELTIPVRLGFEYDGKRYMYIITLTNKQPLDAKRLPLIGGSGEGDEMSIEVLEENEDGEPLAATYTITNGTWGDNASHLSLFKYKPLTADVIEGYNGAVVVFAEDVPSSEGNAYGWIPAGFVCPAGWINIENTDKFVYTFSDEEKAKGIEDYSIFFNASGTLKDCTVTIKGLYLVTDVNATVEEIEAVGIKNITPAATIAAPAGVYTLSGVKVGALQHGLNIVKMADGSVKKIFVK